jgi:hypothetical protein
MSAGSPAPAFAARLRVNAAVVIVMTGAAFAVLPFLADFQKPVSRLLWIGLAASGGAALALSAYLLFDSMLFRLMATCENEAEGGIEIDRFLARAGLRALPETNRTMAERMAGTGRLLLFQRMALLVFAALFVSMLLA